MSFGRDWSTWKGVQGTMTSNPTLKGQLEGQATIPIGSCSRVVPWSSWNQDGPDSLSNDTRNGL